MQLQIALDRLELDVAVRVTAQVAEHADWIEVGTSLIKRYGMRGITEVVAASGSTPVLADLKTADDAATEFGMAFEHGARAATVLAATTDATVDRCAELAREAGAELVLDLMAVSGQRRDALLEQLPREVVFAAHVGKDAQASGVGVESVLGPWMRDRRVAVAGGLTESDVGRLGATYPNLRVIVGSLITKAPDPGAMAAKLAEVTRKSVEGARSDT